jgi:hypothetical protein
MGIKRYPVGVNNQSRINRWRNSQGEHLARLGRKIRADKESRAEAEGTEEPGHKAGHEPGRVSDVESSGEDEECSTGLGAYGTQRPGEDGDAEDQGNGAAGAPLQTA